MKLKLPTGWWPWHRKGHHKHDEPGRDPVVLVPGLCGSVLSVRDRETGETERVWVVLEHSDEEYKKLWGRFDAETGALDPLVARDVLPMDSADGTEFPAADGLYGVDTLDPDMVWPVGAVHYYRELIAHLKSKGYVAGKDLYGCPYDFRQSNRLQAQLDRLQARLEGAVRRSGGRRASVVSHSMGGLLVKCLLAERPQVFERLVGKWITIATPFRGAPGVACDAILSGVEFVRGWEEHFFVTRPTFQQLCAQSPAMHELLPAPGVAFGGIAPTVRLWTAFPSEGEGADGSGVQPCELVFGLEPDTDHADDDGDGGGGGTWRASRRPPPHFSRLLEARMAGNKVMLDGQEFALPYNSELFRWAETTRYMLDQAELPASVQFFSVVGIGTQAPIAASYGSEDAPITSWDDLATAQAQFVYTDGDGTVPYASARGDGFSHGTRVPVDGTHRGLLTDPMVLRLVSDWLALPVAEAHGAHVGGSGPVASQVSSVAAHDLSDGCGHEAARAILERHERAALAQVLERGCARERADGGGRAGVWAGPRSQEGLCARANYIQGWDSAAGKQPKSVPADEDDGGACVASVVSDIMARVVSSASEHDSVPCPEVAAAVSDIMARVVSSASENEHAPCPEVAAAVSGIMARVVSSASEHTDVAAPPEAVRRDHAASEAVAAMISTAAQILDDAQPASLAASCSSQARSFHGAGGVPAHAHLAESDPDVEDAVRQLVSRAVDQALRSLVPAEDGSAHGADDPDEQDCVAGLVRAIVARAVADDARDVDESITHNKSVAYSGVDGGSVACGHPLSRSGELEDVVEGLLREVLNEALRTLDARTQHGAQHAPAVPRQASAGPAL